MWTRVALVLATSSIAWLVYVFGSWRLLFPITNDVQAGFWVLGLALTSVFAAVPFCFPFRGIRWVGLLIAVAMIAQAFTLLWVNALWFEVSLSVAASGFGRDAMFYVFVWLLVMGPFAGLVTFVRLVFLARGMPAPQGPPPSEDPKYYPLTRI